METRLPKTIRSSIAYQGNKFKLIPEILKIIPKDTKVFLDVFGGSGTVSANVSCETIRYNELDQYIFDIIRMLRDTPPQELIKEYNKVVRRFKLNPKNPDAYYRFRTHYRRNPDLLKLFVLSKHSFSSQIRFSKKGFDMPFGKRGGLLSGRMVKTFNEFHSNMQGVKLSRLGAASFVQKCISKYEPKGTVFYFDPPYLASGANVYRPKWTVEHEIQLLKLLDYLDSNGYKFILSNVTKHGKHVNSILEKWMKSYKVAYPKFAGKGEGYVIHRAASSIKNNKTVEVLVTNF